MANCLYCNPWIDPSKYHKDINDCTCEVECAWSGCPKVESEEVEIK